MGSFGGLVELLEDQVTRKQEEVSFLEHSKHLHFYRGRSEYCSKFKNGGLRQLFLETEIYEDELIHSHAGLSRGTTVRWGLRHVSC